jgi:hypothetical protein
MKISDELNALGPYKAMIKWYDLSALSLIDRTHLYFGPGNCRWAKSERERQGNEQFYRSLAQR